MSRVAHNVASGVELVWVIKQVSEHNVKAERNGKR